PWTAAMIGFRIVWPILKRRSWICPSSSGAAAGASSRSIPAQNDGPLPLSTIVRTVWSSPALSIAATNSLQSPWLSAFRFSGRFNAIRSTWPCRTVSINFNLHAEKCGAECLALRIGMQRDGASAAECFMEEQVDRSEIRQFEALHLALYQIS